MIRANYLSSTAGSVLTSALIFVVIISANLALYLDRLIIMKKQDIINSSINKINNDLFHLKSTLSNQTYCVDHVKDQIGTPSNSYTSGIPYPVKIYNQTGTAPILEPNLIVSKRYKVSTANMIFYPASTTTSPKVRTAKVIVKYDDIQGNAFGITRDFIIVFELSPASEDLNNCYGGDSAERICTSISGNWDETRSPPCKLDGQYICLKLGGSWNNGLNKCQ